MCHLPCTATLYSESGKNEKKNSKVTAQQQAIIYAVCALILVLLAATLAYFFWVYITCIYMKSNTEELQFQTEIIVDSYYEGTTSVV
jgi:flagellar biosynthesis/type III secretory pathway M-ring protein FliF/YscJ